MHVAPNPYDATPLVIGTAQDGRTACVLLPFPPERADDLGLAFAAIEPWVSYPYPADGLARYFADPEPTAPRYAIMAGSEIVGVVGLRLNWLRGPYLQFLGILPAHQGQGVGGHVLTWLERAARSAGDRNLWVCASDFNLEGMKFYERHGFGRIGEIDGLVRDGKTEVLLRKRLGWELPTHP